MKPGINYLLIFLLLISVSLFAKETTPLPDPVEKEVISTEYKTVNGLENWTYNYDISDYPDGEYNLIIKSIDKAGNVTIADPINIFVNSESDLSVVSISSPTENMRVGGDFTIIGTAKDDDGIDFVEVKLDDGSFKRAKGKDFWSLFFKVKSIPDGVHTLTARSTDINGVQGKEVSTTFNLDTIDPEITVTSHNNGEILSGTIVIKGKVVDANGVKNLEYSLDGETYNSLKLSGKIENEERDFALKIDTRKNKGGTQYIWFKTMDGTGSDGSMVFVYYSDNQKPEIVITSPAKDRVLNGFVTVSGTVHDDVGLADFSCLFNKKEVHIPLITGNPYWSHTFDFTGMNSGVIIFTAVDLSGNKKSYKLKLKMDNKADLPVLSLLDSNEKNIIGNIDPVMGCLKGIATDDDGVKSVEYSIDKSEYKSIHSNGPFVVPVKDLKPGKHTIELFAVDKFDLKGKSKKFRFNILNTVPEISLDTYTADKISNEPFVDGVIFMQGKTAKIDGIVSGGEGPLDAAYTIGSRPKEKVRISNGKFSISLPKDLEEGGYDLKLTVTDSLGRGAMYSTRIYFSPQPEKGKKYKPFRNEKEDGIFIEDARLSSGQVANISKEKPLTGFITGHIITKKMISPAVVDTKNPKNSKEAVMDNIITADTIESAVLEPEQDNFKIEYEGSRFTIIPLSESQPVSLNVKIETTQGKEYTSKKINVGSDNTKPVLNVFNTGNSILTDTLHLSGTYSDGTGIEKTDIEFSGTAAGYGSSRELKNEKNENANEINMGIDLLSMEEGDHFYTITVTDIFGNTTSETIPFIIDRTPAELSLIIPNVDTPISGLVTVVGKIEDFVDGGSLSFSENGVDFKKVPVTEDNDFSLNIDLSREELNSEDFIFKLTDRGGNITELKPGFKIDRELDRPKVSIERPAGNVTIRDNFEITGLVFDDDEIGKIFYKMDDGEFVELKGNKYFNIPCSLDDLNDGEHTVTVRAADSGGFMSKDVNVSFIVSKAEPVSSLLSPDIETYNKSIITLKGQTYDENGIDSVFISYDNGITYNKAILGKEEIVDKEDVKTDKVNNLLTTVNWSYIFDTRLLKDGTHSILIKAIDKAGTIGIASTIINIDNTIPEIKLDYPGESDRVASSLIIDGKVFDGIRIKSVNAEIKSLDSDRKSTVFDIKTVDVFRKIISLEDYKSGLYNLTITVTDYADNNISETRNFQIIPLEESQSATIYFPEEGKNVIGPFSVEGRLKSINKINKVLLKLDGEIIQTSDLRDNGLFSFSLDKKDVSDGSHSLSVESGDAENSIVSEIRKFSYTSNGPWLKVDNLISGQFVSGRPLITGTAGYNGPNADDKLKRVEKVEVSLDNGQHFVTAKGREKWEFRLETYDLPEGRNQLIIRTFLKDGKSSVTKLFVNIDETPPKIDLFLPKENKKFNGSVAMVGTAGDSNGLKSVEVLIRKGGKEKYQIPSFIQGLYIDMHALGATYGEIGVGLSFFDDVVKLQAQVGVAPPGRFSGLVIGGNLLANIIDIPFSYFFGYDWDFFSMSVAVGANFNYFTMSDDSIKFTNQGVILGAVLAQFEFAKFDFKNLKILNKYSLYFEGTLWFISSDIQAGIVPRYSIGTRIGVF